MKIMTCCQLMAIINLESCLHAKLLQSFDEFARLSSVAIYLFPQQALNISYITSIPLFH